MPVTKFMKFSKTECPNCKTWFVKKIAKHTFCSQKCFQYFNREAIKKYQKWYRDKFSIKKQQMTLPPRKCAFCEGVFAPKSRIHKYCSKKCMHKGWHLIHRPPKPKKPEIKREFCEICKFSIKEALHVHHLNPKLRSERNLVNLMVLCANCHSILHAKIGHGKSVHLTREDVYKLLGKATIEIVCEKPLIGTGSRIPTTNFT